MRRITAYFSDERKYFENSLGREFDYTDATGPYEYLLGALAGCFISTFNSLKPEELKIGKLEVVVEGEKRTDIPTTLKDTWVKVKATDVSSEKDLQKYLEKAAECCSIWQTISHVSKMHLEVSFG